MSVHAVEWGDVSSWVSGIGSLAAVVVALSFAVIQRIEQRNEQLRSIYAWAEFQAADGWHLVVNNTTQYPVYEWLVVLTWATREGQASTDSVSAAEVGLMPPGLNRYSWNPADAAPMVDSGVGVSITFRDAAGGIYERTSSGALRKRAIGVRLDSGDH